MAWVRSELDSIGIPPLKRFGQNFLIDKGVRERLIDLAELTVDDTVLEVGPGLGFLTEALINRAGRVIAIEKDRALAAYLKAKFSHQKSLTVVEGDALTAQIPDGSKVVSSPPYNISSKLILLIMNSRFRLAALLMQEEFVRRLTASSGSREYGRISVMLQSKAAAEFVMKVPREAFYPKPRVDSALVTIRPTSDKLQVKNQELFVDMVRSLFTQRRRMLRGVLARYLKARYPTRCNTIIQHVTLLDKRIYELNPREVMTLSNQIVDATTESERD
ncbi:MAG: 16S rRNA (adenine(1518)-N(6)/adenine(1519)-N(6))-dimethyltransferase RsmA [Candidatus Bathyarchaeia archaeon]